MRTFLLIACALLGGAIGLTEPVYGQNTGQADEVEDQVESGDQFQQAGQPDTKVTVKVTGLTTGNKRVKITKGTESGETDNAHGTSGVIKSGEIGVTTEVEDEEGEKSKKTDWYRVRPGGVLEHKNSNGTWTKMVPVSDPNNPA